MYDRVTPSLVFIDSTALSLEVESSKVIVQTFPSVLNVNLVSGKDEVIGFISDVGCFMSWFREVKCLEIREELDTVAVTTGCDLDVRVAVKDVCVIESTRTIGDVTSSVASVVVEGAMMVSTPDDKISGMALVCCGSVLCEVVILLDNL